MSDDRVRYRVLTGPDEVTSRDRVSAVLDELDASPGPRVVAA